MHARKWVAGVAHEVSAYIKDTWGWELQSGAAGIGSVVKGLIRVKKGPFIGQLLSASGRSHDGSRFFLDPLAWEGTPAGVKPFVSWIDKDPQEKDNAYASRVAKLAIEYGIARGWRQLGVRSMSEESKVVTKRSQSWVMRSAPRHRDADDVVRFLQAAHFTEVELNVKKREKFGVAL